MWTQTADRLPPNLQLVLVHDTSSDHPYTAYCYNGYWFQPNGYSRPLAKIDRWMEIPSNEPVEHDCNAIIEGLNKLLKRLDDGDLRIEKVQSEDEPARQQTEIELAFYDLLAELKPLMVAADEYGKLNPQFSEVCKAKKSAYYQIISLIHKRLDCIGITPYCVKTALKNAVEKIECDIKNESEAFSPEYNSAWNAGASSALRTLKIELRNVHIEIDA